MTDETMQRVIRAAEQIVLQLDACAAQARKTIPPEIFEIAQRQTETWQKATAQFDRNAVQRLEAGMALLREFQKQPPA